MTSKKYRVNVLIENEKLRSKFYAKTQKLIRKLELFITNTISFGGWTIGFG